MKTTLSILFTLLAAPAFAHPRILPNGGQSGTLPELAAPVLAGIVLILSSVVLIKRTRKADL
jgi:prolyl-tRNA editing enzyme YbaK/EbsC (Cys-tRNA(Pro) deacylase)